MKFKKYLIEMRTLRKSASGTGWLFSYKEKEFMVKSTEASGLFTAKQMAYDKFNVPKSERKYVGMTRAYDGP